MDAFFASIEQRDNPQLKGKPVVVGKSSERGVIAAASYEARKYGIHSAMSSVKAKKLCPQLIFTHSRHEVYKDVSQTIISILKEYTDLIEPLSIDEAFLDVTENKLNIHSATLIAKELKNNIFNSTNLTASAGISYNKFLAKIASDQQKPNGLTVIEPKQAHNFLMALPIKKYHGIGKITAEKMHKMGIQNGYDLIQLSERKLINSFGKTGLYYYNIVRGIDKSPVLPNKIRKSIGIETTFSHDLTSIETQKHELDKLIDRLWERILKHDKYGRTLTLKIKHYDFDQFTRSTTSQFAISNRIILHNTANNLLDSCNLTKSIRLIGLSISNLVNDLFINKTDSPTQLKFPFK